MWDSRALWDFRSLENFTQCKYASIGWTMDVLADGSMSVLLIYTIEMSKANNSQCLGSYTKKLNNIGQALATSFDKKSHVHTRLDLWEMFKE